MSQVNFDAMSDAELKRYFLSTRPDQAAFQAYLDRFSQCPKSLIASPSDPDFDTKIQTAIRQKLEALRSSQPANICLTCDRDVSRRRRFVAVCANRFALLHTNRDNSDHQVEAVVRRSSS